MMRFPPWMGWALAGPLGIAAFHPDSLSPSWFEDSDARVDGTPPAIESIVPTARSTLSAYFTNTTTAQQPSEVGGWLTFDGTADNLPYAGSKSDLTFLHYSSAGSNFPVFTAAFPIDIDLTAANGIFYTGTSAGRGFKLTVAATGVITAEIYGTAGTLASAVSAAGVIATDVPAICIVRSDGSTLTVYVDGVVVATDATYTGTPEAGDCTNTPTLGYDGTSYLSGSAQRPFFIDSALSDANREALESWYSTTYSIPLAADVLEDAELASWDGLQVWLDPTNTGDLTMGADDTYADLDMENVGVGSWTSLDSTLSKETGSPSGIGSQVLRVTATAPTFWAYPGTGGSIVGNRYGTTGYARGDGTALVALLNGAAVPIWVGTASSTWQTFDAEFTQAASGFFRVGSGASSGWVEFDDLAFENISLTSITPRAGALTDAFSNATSTAQPWIDSTTGAIRFDGTADKLTYAGTASEFSFLHTQDMTLFAVAKFDDTTGIHTILGTLNTDGISLRNATGAANIELKITNDSGSFDLVASGAEISAGTMQVFDARISGAAAYLDVDGVQVDTGAFTSDAGAGLNALTVGTLSTDFFQGEIGDVLAFNRALSLTEHYRLRNKLAAKWSITLP